MRFWVVLARSSSVEVYIRPENIWSQPLSNQIIMIIEVITWFNKPTIAVLDVLIVNQTADTLQNISLELSTVGDLKLVDKPMPITLAPADFTNIKVGFSP